MSTPEDVDITASSRLRDVLAEKEVDDFLKSQTFSTPFDTWAWLDAADGILREEQKCFVVARSSTGDLLGWLPLRASDEVFLGLRFSVLRLLTDPKSDRHSLQISSERPELLNQLVNVAKSHLGGWSAVFLDEMSGAQFKDTMPSGWSTAFKRITPIYIFSEGDRSSAAQLIGKRGRRARKKVENLEHTFKVWRPERGELEQLMRDIREVEKASWKGEQGVGIFNTDESFEFFRTVALNAAAAGSLVVATVHVEGRLASYRFGFEWRDIFYDYNFAYLPEHSGLSLGRVLLDEMIVRGLQMGLRGIDGSRVGGSYENLLRERSDEGVEHRRWMSFRWTLGGALLRLKYRVLKPLKLMVKRVLKSSR